MNIPIELAVIGVIFMMFVLWAIWFNLSKAYYKWRYKEENDRARQGKGSITAREPAIKDAVSELPRPSPIEGRGLLPTAEPNNAGEDSLSNRKVSFFRRIAKRRK